jgi:phenylalanyl-tRNA synthetase beta chain
MEAFAGVKNASITYEEPSKFPPMTYDLSVVLPGGTFFADLKECWKGLGENILKKTFIVDTYDTDTIHSVTIRFEFVSSERTLESSEVQAIMDEVIENLAKINVNLRA